VACIGLGSHNVQINKMYVFIETYIINTSIFVWFTIANNNEIKNASKVILIKIRPHNTNILHNKKYKIRL